VSVRGPELAPRTRYHWQVAVTSADELANSAGSSFETGHDDWTATWITHDPSEVDVVDAPDEGDVALPDHGLRPPVELRRKFTVRTTPDNARLYITARGLYEAHVNGHRVGDHELAPGWTDYRDRVDYQTHDVTELLQPGENLLDVTVADGWWSGYVGFDPRRCGAHYGTVRLTARGLRPGDRVVVRHGEALNDLVPHAVDPAGRTGHRLGRLDRASARYESVRGTVGTAWSRVDGVLGMDVTVPPGATATVHVPTADPGGVRERGLPVREAAGVRFGHVEPGMLACRLTSGDFHFTAAAPPPQEKP
jgi:hypothetical protein